MSGTWSLTTLSVVVFLGGCRSEPERVTVGEDAPATVTFSFGAE